MTLQQAVYVGAAFPFFVALLAMIFLFLRNAAAASPRSPLSTKLPVRVAEVRQEALGIKSFRLKPLSGAALPKASAGSHINVYLKNGLIRQYSICNFAGASNEYQIAVKLEENSRGGSQAMHALRAGDVLDVSTPRNNFELVDGASKYLLFAGGIGITPLLAMVRALELRGAAYHLHYFTRSLGHTAFHAEFLAERFAGKVSLHHGLDPDQLRRLLPELMISPEHGAHLYMCGPRPFMDLVEAAAAPHPSIAVHREYFSAEPSALARPKAEFEVVLARSGKELVVPTDASLLDVLSNNGVSVEHSCQEGVCGTCLTRVLEGEPDHRDSFLTASERSAGDRMLVCVSRAKSAKLVLEL